ncbi:MAG: GAF domain-containing protein, partial [Burkholderiaceae bacterium]
MKNPRVSIAGIFPGDSAAHTLLREYDWNRSPLGKPQDWPPALKTAVRMALSSGFPMFVAWGPRLNVIYNAAYADILGSRHPGAFGCPLREIWRDVENVLGSMLELTATGSGFYCENTPLLVVRDGYEEKLWLTFSLAPLQNDAGINAGFYGICTETTGQVLAQRRQALQLQVADAMRGLSEPEDICAVAARLLGRHLEASQVLFGRGQRTWDRLDWFAGYRDDADPGTGWHGAEFGLPCPAAGHGARLVANDLAHAPFGASDLRRGWEANGIRAAVAVPLDTGRSALCLLVAQDRPRRWTAAEI